MKSIAALVAATLFAASANAALVNGGFEGLSGTYANLAGAGDTSIPGWTTTLNGVEWFAPSIYGWTAYEGVDVVDLAYYTTAGGGIQQTFSVVPGQLYDISFAVGSVAAFGRTGSTGIVSGYLDGNLFAGTSVSTVNTADIDWVNFTFFSQLATGSTMTIEFQNLEDPLTHFAFIDAVTVTPVPEPATLGLLLSAGLLLSRRTR